MKTPYGITEAFSSKSLALLQPFAQRLAGDDRRPLRDRTPLSLYYEGRSNANKIAVPCIVLRMADQLNRQSDAGTEGQYERVRRAAVTEANRVRLDAEDLAHDVWIRLYVDDVPYSDDGIAATARREAERQSKALRREAKRRMAYAASGAAVGRARRSVVFQDDIPVALAGDDIDRQIILVAMSRHPNCSSFSELGKLTGLSRSTICRRRAAIELRAHHAD